MKKDWNLQLSLSAENDSYSQSNDNGITLIINKIYLECPLMPWDKLNLSVGCNDYSIPMFSFVEAEKIYDIKLAVCHCSYTINSNDRYAVAFLSNYLIKKIINVWLVGLALTVD